MNKIKFFVPVISFILLGGILWRGLYLDTRTLPSMLIDKEMPTFSLITIDGESVENKDLPNQTFLLNVWGSYCLPCLVEHPTFMRLSEEGQIPVVGINYKDRNELAKGWLETNGNPFAYSIEDLDGRFGIDLGVYGAPETYLVDSEGVIRYRHVSVLDET
ncbi:MAG: DsbE family thiol:disulfide interchange protein, partial [Gammaproteobacteria bacterium]|nr:DsbE family thiol:disulfide interchange protein [Gammaproteobacteria bacterium]